MLGVAIDEIKETNCIVYDLSARSRHNPEDVLRRFITVDENMNPKNGHTKILLQQRRQK